MARGRYYAKLPLSDAARLSFSDLCILLFLFLSLCRLCVCVFLCSHWSLVDVPLIFFCPADHVPDWQPRVLLGMVEARSVNVKKTTTTTVCVLCCVFSSHSFWTSSSLDVPAGVTQEECHTGFFIHLLSAVRALIFLARRIQPFLSLVKREVEFCVLTIQSFSTRWAFLFLFF